MPEPTRYTKFQIKVKSSTSINPGEGCKVTNLTRQSVTLTGEFSEKNECVLNPANSNVEWVAGDKLMTTISGRLVGSKESTLTKGGIQINVTTAADTTSPAIDL